MNKKKVFWIFIIICIIGTWYFFTVKKSEEPKDKTQKEVTEDQLLSADLIKKYGAINGLVGNLIYTAEMQDRLVNKGPVLLRGYIEDIFKKDKKTFIVFSSGLFSLTKYKLELEYNGEDLEKKFLFKNKKDYFKSFDEYFVVAEIKEVSRPAISLKGSIFSEDTVEIEIDLSNTFIGNGVCLDIVDIKNDDPFSGFVDIE
jgi:hypothetical protein